MTYQQLIATQRKDEVTKLLMKELGLKSRTTLWGYLQVEVGQMGQVGPSYPGLEFTVPASKHQGGTFGTNPSKIQTFE